MQCTCSVHAHQRQFHRAEARVEQLERSGQVGHWLAVNAQKDIGWQQGFALIRHVAGVDVADNHLPARVLDQPQPQLVMLARLVQLHEHCALCRL
eukprot:scaffold17683_cov69-Phaeocystis_antarctica.AAC.13